MNEFLKMSVPRVAFAISAQDVRIYMRTVDILSKAKYQILDTEMKDPAEQAATSY